MQAGPRARVAVGYQPLPAWPSVVLFEGPGRLLSVRVLAWMGTPSRSLRRVARFVRAGVAADNAALRRCDRGQVERPPWPVAVALRPG